MNLPESTIILRDFAERTSSALTLRKAASTTNLSAFQDSNGDAIGLELIRAMAHNKKNIVTVFGPPGSGKTTWATALAVACRQIFEMYGVNLKIDYVYYDQIHALRELFLKKNDSQFTTKSDWATSNLMVAQIEAYVRLGLPPNTSHLIIAEFVNLQGHTQDRGETIVPRVARLSDVNSHHIAFVPNPKIQEITMRQREVISRMKEVENIDLFYLMMKEIDLDLSQSVRKDNLAQKQEQLKTIVSKMGNAQAIESLTALLAQETDSYIKRCNLLPTRHIAGIRDHRNKIIKKLPSEIARDSDKRTQTASMMLYWLDLFSQWNVPYERGHVLVGNTLAQALIPSLLEEIGPLYGENT